MMYSFYKSSQPLYKFFIIHILNQKIYNYENQLSAQYMLTTPGKILFNDVENWRCSSFPHFFILHEKQQQARVHLEWRLELQGLIYFKMFSAS